MYVIPSKSRRYRFKYSGLNPDAHWYLRKRSYKKYNFIKDLKAYKGE